MNCSAHGNPMPQSKNYKWIDNRQQERSVQNLSIPSATVNDTGHYLCVVSINGFYGPLSGTSITTVTVWCKYRVFLCMEVNTRVGYLSQQLHIVMVICKPVTVSNKMYFHVTDLHISIPSSRELTGGDTLVIECTSVGEPKPTFNPWLHTGTFIPSRTFPVVTQNNKNILTITGVSYTDTGNYQCSAYNSQNMYKDKVATVTVRCECCTVYVYDVFNLKFIVQMHLHLKNYWYIKH